MVGFGSSLRMARRSGWERAYLDYETLKMLLSQIEAVYEEEWQRDEEDDDRRRQHPANDDYRDFLFLESDSDVAFASSASEVLRGEDSSDSSTDEEAAQRKLEAKPFTLGSYSQETESDEEDYLDAECGARSLTYFGWRRDTNAPAVEQPSKKKLRKKMGKRTQSPSRRDPHHASDSFFVGQTTFLGQESGESTGPLMREPSSLLNTSFQQGFSTESTALLQQPVLEEGGSFYSFNNKGDALTPPRGFSGGVYHPSVSVGVSVGRSSRHSKQEESLVLPSLKPREVERKKLQAERRRKRRQRRRRKHAKRRRELERRVPPQLRRAHVKARSITERFLGLLRAEVEKVTLFAQSRLGELADTAGSLRFPSCDDSEFGSFRSRASDGYQHPLSDGGMHPSASSSDDEHGATGTFPWTDTSDEDDQSEPENKSGISPRKKISTGNMSSVTIPTTNISTRMRSSKMEKEENQMTLKAKNSAFAAAQRQINHFTTIRCERPTFQRNDHIVGEDLLLLSAVDEADGYTAVGVELMHVLKFISVNTIALRKICKKHDRLLMNRMLGGYYHRRRKELAKSKESKDAQFRSHSLTLGSIVSRSLGEDCDVDPAAATGLNENKLVGVYDLKVQGLANSPTVQVVSSCLALALAEYEVSQSRAKSLSKLNPVAATVDTPLRTGAGGGAAAAAAAQSSGPFGLSPSRWISNMNPTKKPEPEYESLGVETPYDSDLDSEHGDTGPPSTASSVSLTRLRFTVVSIFALRESARFKVDYEKVFLCRSFLAFSGSNVVGEGLDGCSREVLDFYVSYEPDAALLLDAHTLYQGLQDGKWKTVPIGTVMLSVLSVSFSPPVAGMTNKEMVVQNAVSILPTLSVDDPSTLNEIEKTGSTKALSRDGSSGDEYWDQLPKLSRVSCFLYSMNDYISHATANTFVRSTEAHPAYSANIMGATSFAALFAIGLQCYFLSKGPIGHEVGPASLRVPFVIAAVLATLGNAIYIVGISREYISVAVIGRLLIGFGSTELFHRQIVINCLPPVFVVPESARLVNWKLCGRALGLFVGAVLGSFSLKMGRLTIGAFQSASYLMCLLWTVHAFRLIVLLPRGPREEHQTITYGDQDDSKARERANSLSEEFSSDESETVTPKPEIYQSSAHPGKDSLNETYTAAERALMRKTDAGDENTFSQSLRDSGGRRRPLKGWMTLIKRIRKLLQYNVALPVTLVLVVLARLSHEIFFTSCPIIAFRYFHWSGSQAALFLAALSASVVLINYVCGTSTTTYDERTVIKRSLMIFGVGLLFMINYTELFSLATHVENLLDETEEATYYRNTHPYDGNFGIVQYVVGFAVVFAGMMTLEGASLSLMSKVAPPRLKNVVINCGTIVTFCTFVARVSGDVHILFVGLSHRLINTDIVNSLAIPLFLASFAAYYIVKRHFFFLM